MSGRRPDFIIVGAAKSGTTSMFETLGTHPEIFIPENKEPWFYSLISQDLNKLELGPQKKRVIQNYNTYSKLFDRAKADQLCGEASTVYLYDYERTIHNISKLVDDWQKIKILILLRNPVYRAFSHYMNDCLTGYEKRPFREVIELCINRSTSRYRNYLEYGLYSNQVKSYLENFEHVKIVIFEQMLSDQTQIIDEIFKFLGCSIVDFENHKLKKENTSGRPKYPIIATLLTTPNPIKTLLKFAIPKDTRKIIANMIRKKVLVKEYINDCDRDYLKQYYKEDIAQLESILGYRLDEWK
jgi:hypothetical protein